MADIHRSKRVHLPKRETKKVTLTLPTDTIELLDVCSGAMGINRSNFLSLLIDGFYDEIISFAKGYAIKLFEEEKEEESEE